MSTSRTSRTSTEARFRRGLIGTLVVLALICVGFGTASVLQGPKLQGARIDTAAAVSAPSTLRLVLDEAVTSVTAKQVSVSPKAPLTVSTDGDVVLVRFTGPLDYSTHYSVTLSGVRAEGGGSESILTQAFRTPEFAAYWVARTANGDHVMHGEPTGKATDVFDAPRIQDFLVLPSALFVVGVSEDNQSTAEIVDTDGLNHEDVTLPGSGRIGLLEYVGSTVLYTFTSADTHPIPEFDDTLFALDLSGTHLSTPVLGLDGKPFSVDGLQIVPGSTAVFIHARSADLLSWNVKSKAPPTLLSSFTKTGQLAADGHRISATDAFGSLIYDTADGSEVRANPSPINALVPYIADIIPMSGNRWVERAAVATADGESFDISVAVDNGATAQSVYSPPAGSSIIDYRVTPNERYLVVEVAATIDSAGSLNPRPLDRSTVVIDLKSKSTVATWNGGGARW